MIDLAARVSRIIEKLEKARSNDLECFGSERHRFELNPPLAESEVTAFELEHRVKLPEDYRAFLLRAGNGGAGPYYGINPLQEYQGWFPEAAETL